MEGRISNVAASGTYGFIDCDGEMYFFHRSEVVNSDMPTVGAPVEFEAVETDRGHQARNVSVMPYPTDVIVEGSAVASATNEHANHCFVVMPFGRNQQEIRWHRGWFETVISPAVVQAGYHPVLAATEERPNAINDEIRTHLALDAMVVVDLGGATAQDPPNPNVMYELGIRHALGLPLVMMAWAGQTLPFDISNQRVIMEERELLDIEPTKEKLAAFIEAARQGHFYRPMEAVGRIATIDAASDTLGERSILGALAREVRDLRRAVSRTGSRPTAVAPDGLKKKKKKKTQQMTHLLTSDERKRLQAVYLDAGGQNWSAVMGTRIADLRGDDPAGWEREDWEEYVRESARLNPAGTGEGVHQRDAAEGEPDRSDPADSPPAPQVDSDE